MQQLRANLWLLFLTLLLCSVLYPLALWGIGQTLFHNKADGSLVSGANDKKVGSRLIAQAFNGDEYFQPRPSATSDHPYNAMASGASNFAANNPKLRARVAQQLGTLVRYRSPDGPGKGKLAGEDVEAWFQKVNDPSSKDKRNLTAEWADNNSSLVGVWATSSDEIKAFVRQWAKEHPGVITAWQVSQWKAQNPNAKNPPRPEDLAPFKFDEKTTKPEDLAPGIFDTKVADSFVMLLPGMWPCTVEEEKPGTKEKEKNVKPDNNWDDIRSIFFDMWLQEHRDAVLEPVPADLVMASASGLDPHITLKNALYQLERVSSKWAEKTKRDPAEVRKEIDDLLHQQARAPLAGLAGVPLVNVLEVNLALAEKMKR
jgi:potassium-transporting ATPase KdpC subunit